jgi:phage portal protein BeeE
LSPNEARAVVNLPPVAGGESPYLQQQNWPLAALADRPAPDTAKGADIRFERFMDRIARGLAS